LPSRLKFASGASEQDAAALDALRNCCRSVRQRQAEVGIDNSVILLHALCKLVSPRHTAWSLPLRRFSARATRSAPCGMGYEAIQLIATDDSAIDATSTIHGMGSSRRLVNLVDAPDWDEVASKGVLADAMLQLALIAQRQRASVREPVAALCDLLTTAVQR